ncbi:hypothetical protein [Novosphingobium sp. RL4]|uniref:hypothetical protein n=1 Tax=Novosphingobium sp. RL4 TaxID=3109595 RepID=UPI002D7907A2|nr:hypothetical protein [Novosphingobium sp. RL4]WRT91886.1 hypothetical protein U9J33_11755 [Novosphingobium sp. RL4]
MSKGISATGLFCEDFRQEISGAHTLVGIFSDTITISDVPGLFPKLVAYVRAGLSLDFKPSGPINIYIVEATGSRLLVATLSEEMLKKSVSDAKQKGSPAPGVYCASLSSPFNIPQVGRISLEMEYEGQTSALVSIDIKKAAAGS